MSNPTARIIDLTPEYAANLLDKNPRNRRFGNRNYETVKRAIERGEWELNGEAIKVAVDGYLLDGQHRCRAVLETGIPIQTFLIEGLPVKTQDTMDTGKPRTLGNVLEIRGEKNSARVAAIVTRLVTLERDGLKSSTKGAGGASTVRERLEWFDRNPWVRDMVEPTRAIQVHANFPGVALIASLVVTFDAIDDEDSAFFWERVKDGANLPTDHPIYILRRSLKTIKDDSRGERNERYIAAITVKAWNAYREGRSISALQWRAGGANPEAFPEPR